MRLLVFAPESPCECSLSIMHEDRLPDVSPQPLQLLLGHQVQLVDDDDVSQRHLAATQGIKETNSGEKSAVMADSNAVQ